ncbi:MAG: sulfatase-like hydrolase/transferase [Candidatus Pacebacteria bacterium]|nr:sulfatase-like hydrolase/transferase [Candidatus Paceibacterota bacterium]
MRILYIDIDTLRPDHLGCYGYHRNTSPNIDRLAMEGVRFDNCYVSDSPCLPSRAALYSGKCGIRNGAINHGGAAADPVIESATRGFKTLEDNFVVRLREAGMYPVTVSPFGERHSSFWFYNGFREMYNPGRSGAETADEVIPAALEWLDRKGTTANWYLHVNVWDPHTPYRVPKNIPNPFENEPPPGWMTEEIRRTTWDTYGPGSAQEPGGDFLGTHTAEQMGAAKQIDSMAAYKSWIDGYDHGIHYADQHVGQLLAKLEQLNVLHDTMIIVSSDHGENFGELAVYGDHQTADHITNRVPLIIRHPKGLGGRGRVDRALHYQFDFAATVLDMLGQDSPESWDAESFLRSLECEREGGRNFLVVSNCAWSCQRAVRWDRYILIRTYHSGLHNWPDVMLFDVENDPHELTNLASERPELVHQGLAKLESWVTDEMRRSTEAVDPLWAVMREGGPFHANFGSPSYATYSQRLRDTGREQYADDLEQRRNRLMFKP